MATPLSSQSELRLATYQKYRELQKLVGTDEIKNYSNSMEKSKETYQKLPSYLNEIGAMLALWKTSDYLDLALKEIWPDAAAVFNMDKGDAPPSELEKTNIAVMRKLIEACALRDKAPIPELTWDEESRQLVEKK